MAGYVYFSGEAKKTKKVAKKLKTNITNLTKYLQNQIRESRSRKQSETNPQQRSKNESMLNQQCMDDVGNSCRSFFSPEGRTCKQQAVDIFCPLPLWRTQRTIRAVFSGAS